VDQVMISLLVGAHSMITGVPGLAKTLLIKTLAQILDLNFKRIQFTARPDACGYHRHRHYSGGREHGAAASLCSSKVRCSPTSCLRTKSTELAQDPGGPPGGNGGASGNSAGRDIPDEPALLCTCHPESNRTGRDLPIAGSAVGRFMFNIVIGYLGEDDEHQVVTTTTVQQDIQLERT